MFQVSAGVAHERRLPVWSSCFPGASPMTITLAVAFPSPGTATVREACKGHLMQVRIRLAKSSSRFAAIRFSDWFGYNIAAFSRFDQCRRRSMTRTTETQRGNCRLWASFKHKAIPSLRLLAAVCWDILGGGFLGKSPGLKTLQWPPRGVWIGSRWSAALDPTAREVLGCLVQGQNLTTLVPTLRGSRSALSK